MTVATVPTKTLCSRQARCASGRQSWFVDPLRRHSQAWEPLKPAPASCAHVAVIALFKIGVIDVSVVSQHAVTAHAARVHAGVLRRLVGVCVCGTCVPWARRAGIVCSIVCFGARGDACDPASASGGVPLSVDVEPLTSISPASIEPLAPLSADVPPSEAAAPSAVTIEPSTRGAPASAA